ncbi:MAG: glycoside hydrolase family 140 protein [Armatimonadetes bacterium]|nr:glycoside hydrolase family 140 protein [Armatimonadota bacterium]
MNLRVSDNRRFLQESDGTPFFYLGDTAWELFHRLTLAQADEYLTDRAAKGYTVIQCVALAEFDGLETPNANGDTPFVGTDLTQPNEGYWAHMDAIVTRIAEHGMVAGLLPTWGDKWNKGGWGAGPEIFTPENARVFGKWIGERYKTAPSLIWILGGDRKIESDTHRAIIREMAAGIAEGDAGKHLQTFHPQGQFTSSSEFHNDDWLAFNMYQTGHTFDRDNYRSIGEDYALTPPKPCLDGEPGYEDHPNAFRRETGYMDDYECRKFLWWATLAGACGHTYGCHDIWQFYDESISPPVNFPRTPWREAMQLPGAGQMQHAKNLFLSRPYFSRVPDQSVIVSDTFDDELRRTHHIQASRDANGAYIFVYSASGQGFTVDMSKLSGTATGAWLDPRTGKNKECGTFANTGTQEFTPPSKGRGCDWVLMLDVM